MDASWPRTFVDDAVTGYTYDKIHILNYGVDGRRKEGKEECQALQAGIL